MITAAAEPGSFAYRHSACPDADNRCQHGDDMNCPSLGPAAPRNDCTLCNGSGFVKVIEGGTHAPAKPPITKMKCNCDGTIEVPLPQPAITFRSETRRSTLTDERLEEIAATVRNPRRSQVVEILRQAVDEACGLSPNAPVTETVSFTIYKGLCVSPTKCREAGKCLGPCERIEAQEAKRG